MKTLPKNIDLTSGPIASALLLFALPALGSNILQSVNGSVNAVWVGQFLGATGLAATANANLVMFMMFSLVFGFGMATTIVIGQSVGRGDTVGMRQAVGTGITLFIVLGSAAAVLGWLLTPRLLYLLGTPPDVFPPALTYTRVMFLGLPSAVVTIFLAMAIRGTGDSLTPLLLMLPGMVVDVLMNPVLILGLGPAPRLGIMGAGVATLLANFASLVLMIGVIYVRDLPVRLRGAEFRYLIPRRDLLGLILRKGVPMGMQMIVMSISGLVMLGLVNQAGTDTVAAYGAANQLWTYLQMPAIAIGMAASTMAAQNIGAGRWDRIDRIAGAGIMANLCLTGAMVLLTTLFDRAMLHLFLPADPAAVTIARHINVVASWSFVLMGITMVLSSVTRSNGATMIPLVIMVLAYIPGRLGAAYALIPHIGVDAVWWSFPIGAALSLVLTSAFFRHGGWRKGVLLDSSEEAEELCQSEAEPAGRLLPTA